MRTSDFDYFLPEELIAQEPQAHRDESKMLVFDPLSPDGVQPETHIFSEISDYLNPGDVVVINDTKVIRARLFARKETGARIELFLLGLAKTDSADLWNCFLRPAKRVTPGVSLQLLHADGVSLAPWPIILREKHDDGTCMIEFPAGMTDPILKECGHLPLPPYIKRPDAPMDSERYQTVYARNLGAVAAPTAGLHFTEAVFNHLRDKGVRIAKLTLHVGAGTFKPVGVDKIEDHVMHKEYYVLPQDTADVLNAARAAGKRILAVGTTSLRTLETCVREDGTFAARSGDTGIFIYPPYRIKSADILLTNFHLPKSTLLMLVSAFAGMEQTRTVYRYAVENRFRFFSYGDCMLILNRI